MSLGRNILLSNAAAFKIGTNIITSLFFGMVYMELVN